MNFYYRKKYIDKLLELKDKKYVKVLTGIRWSGKSTILSLFQEKLLKTKSISKNQIIEYDFNKIELQEIAYKELCYQIKAKAQKNKVNYVFLDEVQEIPSWEKCVISLYEEKQIKFDIYITGSNSKLLSTELSTLLTGRHRDIRVMPLSLTEFADVSQNPSLRDAFAKYINIGGLGIIIPNINNEKEVNQDLRMVLEDTINKDIKYRHRNKNNTLINRLIEYVYSVIGKPVSSVNIENYFKSNKIDITRKTIDSYLNWACDAMLLYRVNYFNTKTKTILKTAGKYYAGDLGLLSANIKFNDAIYSFKIENLVFLKFIELGYEVYTSQIYQPNKANKEIDFVAIKDKVISYFQVCETLTDKNYEREINNLLSIRDGNSKNLIVLNDTSTKGDLDRVKRIGLIEFLTREE